jgi:hypothetical protein
MADHHRIRGDQLGAATHIAAVPVPLHVGLGATVPDDDTQTPLGVLRIESPVGTFVFHLSADELAAIGQGATALAARLRPARPLYLPT